MKLAVILLIALLASCQVPLKTKGEGIAGSDTTSSRLAR